MWGSSPVWLPPLYLSLQYGYTSSNTGKAFIESLPPLLLSWLVCLNNDTAMTSMMKIQLYKWGKKVKFLVLPSHQSRLCSLPDGCAIFMMAQRYFSGFPFFFCFYGGSPYQRLSPVRSTWWWKDAFVLFQEFLSKPWLPSTSLLVAWSFRAGLKKQVHEIDVTVTTRALMKFFRE